ncbi:phage tail protein [Selenomonadales bacterium OttesenSCG-928-I06]|nr:phage tail protein [Selenomonadales bacterium OttesenSCG-928-I06]
MAEWSKGVLTTAGKTLQAKVELGETLVLTKMKVGDGELPAGSVLEDLTDLISFKKDVGIINKKIVRDGVCEITSRFDNSDVTEGFYMRELGLYAEDPDDGEILYIIMTASNADYIPPLEVGSPQTQTFKLNIGISSAEQVDIVIDTTGAYTKEETNDLFLKKTAAANTYITKIDADVRYLTAATANSTFLTIESARETYLTANIAANTYLTIENAEDEYLTKTEAASTYLTINTASDMYLTKNSADNKYLTITNANSTYLTKTEAGSTYLTQYNADSTYLSITNATSTYLTQTNAANTYLTQASAENTYLTILSAETVYIKKPNYIDSEIGTVWVSDINGYYTQEFTIEGLTENSIINITPAINATLEEMQQYQALSLFPGEQTEGAFIIKAIGTLNTVNIPIRISVQEG